MQRRRLLASLATVAAPLALAGCGFRLRGAAQFAFGTLVIAAPPTSGVAPVLQKELAHSGAAGLTVLRTPQVPTGAHVVLEIQREQHERSIVGYSASGEVRELQLRLRVWFRVKTHDGRELVAPTELLQRRDISYSETYALAKEAEEALFYQDMRQDIVRQMVRRLAAVRLG